MLSMVYGFIQANMEKKIEWNMTIFQQAISFLHIGISFLYIGFKLSVQFYKDMSFKQTNKNQQIFNNHTQDRSRNRNVIPDTFTNKQS